MYRIASLVLLLIGILCIPTFCRADESTYYSSGVGFGVTLPDGWRFAERDTFADSRNGSRLSDEEINKVIAGYDSTNPLLVQITNKTDDGSDSNSVININVMYFDVDMPLTDLMDMIVKSLNDSLMDFELIEDIRATSMSGHDAAYFRAKHGQADVSYDELPMNSREWVVRRGDILFSIGVTWAVNDDRISEADIDAIVNSIRIDL